ncbi:cellulase N-terminal Ig-like domain-containing protein [Allosphingosinicella deserti]|uniref:Glycoside hydrolase n=1 Tax=Allosphingosinicella deserti TaxID=2116704 RepID=A0A2P7QKJ3_9SPHN|nr:cellulase N-terminal Ig-like domain-containing protein [Sphingomonas deserti]PSJ38481.1 glycoside hydrolase [Sphingomonas deserti]
MKLKVVLALLCSAAMWDGAASAQALKLNDKGYFATQGLNVMVFSDYYPDGHQTGVTIVQHGTRVAANGDLRLEASPGQWSPIPAVGERVVDPETQTVTQSLSYPDPSKDRKGFNPIFYPDIQLGYKVRVTPLEGNSFRIQVDLDRPVPPEWVGKVGFNLELFPTDLFGKSFLMDGQSGIFPRQANGPVVRSGGGIVPVPIPIQANGPVPSLNGEPLAAPLATGRKLVVAPEQDLQRLTIESRSGTLELLDGRLNHNNAWFIVRGTIPAGATTNALEWVVTPHVEQGWRYQPVIQVSQVGYAPDQPKRAVIELDPGDRDIKRVRLFRLTDDGRKEIAAGSPERWGEFLRYDYRVFDFSKVRDPGMYVVAYGDQVSSPFKIGSDVYSRHVWQPTLEYFLPIQMCHMRVNEKYRVWHGLDHQDDALMAPTALNHFDGYVQGPATMTRYKPGDVVPGLNAGGWHDAGDFDLRVESQIGTVWLLAKMVEEFGLDYDATTVDQSKKMVEIHAPDGRNDAVQQIEHGLLSVLGGYRALGRLYRGIIAPSLRQYAMLGDAANHTDGVFRKPVEGLGRNNNGDPIKADDRWVFTEDNPDRELYVAAGLAAAARVMKATNPKLAAEALAASQAVAKAALPKAKSVANKAFVLSELIQSTGNQAYVVQLLGMEKDILAHVEDAAWRLAPALPLINDAGFKLRLADAVSAYQATVKESARTDSPYGVPYKPDIWGAGWTIQERGVRQYFFAKGWPQATDPESWLNALNFVLGVHPGENTSSFASGVGAKSATVAYGTNRAEWSYIPGGVISGTALIRPDLPELKIWPYFWQQTEYVMGGGETNYMFLALAADRRFGREQAR